MGYTRWSIGRGMIEWRTVHENSLHGNRYKLQNLRMKILLLKLIKYTTFKENFIYHVTSI
jgi:hypothetical protein